MVCVVSHPGSVFDEVAHPPCGPKSAAEAARLGSALERAFEITQLGRTELGWPAGVRGLAQSPQARLFQFASSAADRLSMHLNFARDLGLAESCSEQSRRLHPPRLQRGEVPPHTRWITHALYTSKNLKSCHYLMQASI